MLFLADPLAELWLPQLGTPQDDIIINRPRCTEQIQQRWQRHVVAPSGWVLVTTSLHRSTHKRNIMRRVPDKVQKALKRIVHKVHPVLNKELL